MTHTVTEWRVGWQDDPEYVALSTEIDELDARIRGVLSPGFGRVIDRSLADDLAEQRKRLRDQRQALKATFLITREVDLYGDSHETREVV